MAISAESVKDSMIKIKTGIEASKKMVKMIVSQSDIVNFQII